MTLRRYSFIGIVATVLVMGLSLSPLPPSLIPPTWGTSALASTATDAPLFDNLGDYHYPIATQSEAAQQYFDQGMTLAYGFNHAEAARSFQAGIEQDATCAMCYWGLAYVLGPNINAPMDLEAVPTAWEAIQQALPLRSNPKEQALIQALATRYSPDPEADRGELDQAFATAMGTVYQQYPDDPDIGTLYAGALMDTMPWDYWDEAGNPKPETEIILTTLESVIEQNPQHIGALHLYIHAVEKERPELAETAADTLGSRVPGSGHLVHMPSHIYVRIGRYHDAVVANQAAIAADDAYLQGSHVPSIYTLAYMPHNHHFEWFGALMTGQSAIALEAANHTAQIDASMIHHPDFAGALQHYYSMPLYTLVRFERWDDILATPAPDAALKYPTGIWHYAQGMALAAQDQVTVARQHLAAMATLVADPELMETTIWGFNSTSQVLNIAASVLAGEIALADGDYDGAIAHLQQAVDLESQLVYTEPPDWYSPTQNLLGRCLLKAGRYVEAEAAFRADLDAYPENGWSLYGLAQSLQAQGKTVAASEMESRFENAWQYADFPLALRS
ncbi:MAG: tetratricopeptide repeat protein [Cyanobacteria bacterium P01_F01_bin.86]